MPSNKNYLNFILDQLSELEDITYKPKMDDFFIYYRGRAIGGVFNNRLLVKPVKAATLLLPDATYELPYDDGNEMLLVDNVEDRVFLKKLLNAMYDDLPESSPTLRGSGSISLDFDVNSLIETYLYYYLRMNVLFNLSHTSPVEEDKLIVKTTLDIVEALIETNTIIDFGTDENISYFVSKFLEPNGTCYTMEDFLDMKRMLQELLQYIDENLKN